MNVRLLLLAVAGSIMACRQPEPAPAEESAVSDDSTLVAAPLDSQPVPSAQGAPPLGAVDGYPRVSFEEIEGVVRPMLESVERIRTELRADSATHVADSLFLARRALLRETLDAVSDGFDDPTFEAAAYPDGGAAQRLRRERLRAEQPDTRPTMAALRATPEEVGQADSLNALLAKHGIRVQRGEGQVYYELSETFQVEHLGPYLTSEMQEFLSFVEREQVQPSAADASLGIPLDELATRLLSAGRFAQKYPASPVRDIVRSRFQRYLAIYLGGIDNTPAFDRRSKVLRPDWRNSLESFVANHGDTEAGQRVAEYLALVRASDYTRSPEVDAFLRNLWSTLRLVPLP